MRKLQLFFVCLMVAATCAAQKVIQLPKPNMNRAGTVMKALSDRCSTREYADKALTNADLSDLLWAANGINRPDGRRTAPSAMNKQDVDIYVVMAKGAYLYDHKAHTLNLLKEGDFRQAVASGQDFATQAPVSLVLVSELSRMGDAKNERTKLMCAMDAGIVSQNISIFCALAKMGTVPRATMDAAKLKEVLNLTDTQMLMLNHPVGYLKK